MKTPSVFERFVARVLLAIVSFQLAFGTQIAAAQATPAAPAPADTRTTVTSSANGTPVVNIATPNSAGVSHNRFNTYDVGKGGLILNNSAVNAVSMIGGGTAANANLAGGQAASLILNEVVQSNAGSMLAGYQEILGRSAELVIANPWGITCNGCGFVNTPRVTLTTGAPTLNASGALAGFTITGGQLAIGQYGLDATRQSTLDLLARAVSVGGNVIVGSKTNGISGDLQVLAGSNSFDYTTRTGTATSGTGAPPQFAIDSSVLGGMYADRIRLLVNEHGAGVRLAGNVAALADDLVITADGRIDLRGAASSAGDLIVRGGDVQVALADSNTYLYGGRDLSINAADGLDFGTGSIGANRNVSFTTVGSLTDTGGVNDLRFTNSNGVLTADAGGALDLTGGYWTAPQVSFKAASVQFGAGGTVYGSGATGNSVSVTTPGVLSITGGKLYSNADATLGAGRIEVDSAGVAAANGALSATVARGSAGGIDNRGTLQGNSVSIVAAGDAPTTATTFHNAATGKILATNGLVIGESGAMSRAGSALANEGSISGDAVTIGTTDTSNTNAIQATTNLTLNSATVENTGKDALIIGSTRSTGSATLAANTITNNGQIWSAGDLALAPTTLAQQRAVGATANPLIGAGRDLTIAYTGNADLGTGDLRAGRDLTITGAAVTDRGGVSTTTANGDLRYAGRNLVATAAPGGSVTIGGGQWYSSGDLRLSGEDVILGRYFDQLGAGVDVTGVLLAGAQSGTGVVALDARSGQVSLNSNSAVYSGCSSATCQNPSGGDLLITQNTPFALAQPNVLQANGLLSISATGDIDNSGIIQGGHVSLASNNGAVPLNYFNRGTGSLIGTQALQIGTSALPAANVTVDLPAAGYKAGVYGGVLDINTAVLFNNGTLQGVGGRSIVNAGQLVNSGSIQGFADATGQGVLAINADSLLNYGTLFDEATLAINARNFTNMGSGNIASPGVLSIAAGGAGARPALNYGQIGGATLELFFHDGLVNGLDPGVPANRSNPADIFASNSLTIQMENGSSLINYAKIESNVDLFISFIGGGSLLNQMSMLPDSELTWFPDGMPARRINGGVVLLQTGQNGATDRHVIQIGNTGTTSDFYYYFGNQFQTAAYQDVHDATVENQQFAPGVDPAAIPKPTISAGHNLLIENFGSLVNNATIEAVNDATITGLTAATPVTNNSLFFGQRDHVVNFVESFTCQRTTPGLTIDFGCGEALPANDKQDNGPYGGFPATVTYSNVRAGNIAFAAKIVAGGTLMVNGTVQNNGIPDLVQLPVRQDATKIGTITVIPPGAPGSQGSAPTLSVNGATIPLPTSLNGRFISAQSSTQGPLIETNPLFGIDSIALGSDYLAKLLQLNPDTQTRRLGDANYEAYLIQQQLVALTGRSVLEGFGYVANMEDQLFQNAKDEATTLRLGYGKALTAEQVAALKSDIVWMVEEEVQGQKVLVPVVYLTDATRTAQSLSGTDPTLAGYDVNINGGTLTNTGGSIVAANSLNINTAGNIENLSGRIAGWNVQLNAGGDIVNSTLIKRVGDDKNGVDFAQRVATIEAGNTAVLQAGNDIKVNGAWVNAGKDAALIAGNNVDVHALVLNTNITAPDGSWSVQDQRAQGAGVNAGGNAVLRAGQDVNIKGAQVAAGDTAVIRADGGNVNIGVLELKHTASSSSTTTGTYTQLDTEKGNASATLGAGMEHTTTTHTSTDTTGLASGISGNGVEVSTGKGDVNINGSLVDAGTGGILVDSARDVNITAYNNKNERTDTTDRVRAGVQLDASADGAFGGLAQSGDKVSTTTTQTTAQTSALSSKGDIVIKGKGNVTNEGTQFDAAGNVVLAGENVINKAAHDTFTTSTTESKWETKEQEGLTTNGTGDSINNVAQGKGDQISVNNLEWQQRVTASHSTDTNTNEQSEAHGTQINAGGSIIVDAKNHASDEGTQYTAGKDVSISAESYENKAAANTNITTDETTYGSGKVTAGLNSAAEVALTVSADGGHQKSGSGVSAAVVGNINAGGVVVIKGRSGDVTLEGTQISGDKGVGITAAGDLNINQANNTTTSSSSEESGSGRLSASVSLLGTGGSVGAGASTRLANSNETNSHAKVANIKSSGGDVQLAAGGDLTSQGANVDAAGNVDLKAGHDIKLAAATDRKDKTGSVDSGGVDVNVGFGTDAAEDTGSGGVNVNAERGRTDYHEATQHGSNIKAGGNVSIDAGGNALLQGTQVDANSASLKTGGNLVLESAQHTIKDNSYDVGGTLSASVSKGGGTGGASSVGEGSSGSTGAKGGNAGGGGAQVNVMQSKQDIETNTNATINTRGGTTVNVGGDMSLKGANINAQDGVSGKVAGNLTIETRTDKELVDQTNVKAYAGMGPVGGSGGGSKSQRVQEGVQTGANAVGQDGVFADVNAQKKDNVSVGTSSGISGGAKGINLNVGGDTTLTGATNSGTDFNTAGKTIIASVETHSSESDLKFRAPGTVSTLAGSDDGKGGDYGLNVHTPGGHGGKSEEEPHPNVSAHEPNSPPPPRKGGGANEPDTAPPARHGGGAGEPHIPVPHAPLGEGHANTPHPQEPTAPATHVPLSEAYANNPHEQDPTVPVTHPPLSDAHANNSHAQEPNAPATHLPLSEAYANNPHEQDPTVPLTHPPLSDAHANNSHAQKPNAHVQDQSALYAPAGMEQPHQLEAQNGSHNIREAEAHDPGSPLPDQPSHTSQPSPGDEVGGHPNAPHPAGSYLDIPAAHANAAQPALEGYGTAPALRPNAAHPAPDGDDSAPAHEPPAGQHPANLYAREIMRKLIEENPDARALSGKDGWLDESERPDFQRNLAEIVAFSKTPGHDADGYNLLEAVKVSMEGPQKRADGLTEFPLHPQYVGENLGAFDNWKNKSVDDVVPGRRYVEPQPGETNDPFSRVKYFDSAQRDAARVYVSKDGHLEQLSGGGKSLTGRLMFIVDSDGRMLAVPYPKKADLIHHSSLADGKPVLMAGEIWINTKGQVTQILNQSGHFRPDTEAFRNFLVDLKTAGVDLRFATAQAVSYERLQSGAFQAHVIEELLAGGNVQRVPSHAMPEMLKGMALEVHLGAGDSNAHLPNVGFEHVPRDAAAPVGAYFDVKESPAAHGSAAGHEPISESALYAPARIEESNAQHPIGAGEPPAAQHPVEPLQPGTGVGGYGVQIHAHAADDSNAQPVEHPQVSRPVLLPDRSLPPAEQRHYLIDNDARARALSEQEQGLRGPGRALNAAERKDFETNLSEIVAYSAKHPRQAEEMFVEIQTSLQGPQPREGDGLTVFPLRPQYVGENVAGFKYWKYRAEDSPPGQYENNLSTRKVKYYTPDEQESARLFVGADKQLKFKDAAVTDGKWMFVVDSDGRMLARPYPNTEDYKKDPTLEFIHHSSLAAGKPVLMAGQFIIKNGKLAKIDNESGHFRPDTESFKTFLVALGRRGVDLPRSSASAVTYVATERNLFDKYKQPVDLNDPSLAHAPSNRMLEKLDALHSDPGPEHQAARQEPQPAGARVQREQPEEESLYSNNVDQPAVGTNAAPPPPRWVAGRAAADQSAPARANDRDGVTLAATRPPETPEMRPALIQDSVNRILRSNDQVRSLAEQVRALQGNRMNSADVAATERNLAEIVEFTKRQNDPEGDQLLRRFKESLEPPQVHGGVTEFSLLPQYVGENIKGFESWRTQGVSLPGENYGPGKQPEDHHVTYLTEQQREDARIYVRNNEFVTATGKPIGSGRYLFVVDTKGRLIATPYSEEVRQGRIHHSSLTGGEPARMAGEISFNNQSKLSSITNRSGHFRPDQQAYERFLGELVAGRGRAIFSKASATVQQIEGQASGGIEVKNIVDNLFKDLRNHPLPKPNPDARILASLELPDSVQPQVRNAQPAPASQRPDRQGQVAAPADSAAPYTGLPKRAPQPPANRPQSVPQPSGVRNPPLSWRTPVPRRHSGGEPFDHAGAILRRAA